MTEKDLFKLQNLLQKLQDEYGIDIVYVNNSIDELLDKIVENKNEI